jgi:ABC-type proline/glycine betaine transport system ATPase subunit
MGDFDVTFTVYGEPASKANSRKMVLIKGRPALIKSQKARDYVKTFEQQCPVLEVPTTEDVVVEMMIYYASRRPDLDESLILDCMQCRVYKNDRQVKQKFIYWGLDKENPRSVIRVRSCDIKKIPDYLISEDVR